MLGDDRATARRHDGHAAPGIRNLGNIAVCAGTSGRLSGFTKPSQANQAAFDEAIEEVSAVARRLIDSLVTTAPPRDREEWAARARARAAERYGSARSSSS
jgi:hypothetical protein